MEKDIKPKRLIADIDLEIHKRIKSAACWKNISIKKYILQAIIKSLIEDEKYK
jgi:hypothetical protein